ncbi:MAG: reverse transcriptase/maturase family protein [Motiliproteus sp.]
MQLQADMVNGEYQPGNYRQFIIRERKPRLISAAPFRDRVVHHALMNQLEPVLEAGFYHHNYACRPGKGTHRAVDQYQRWAKRYAYVLKLDMARYFPSIRHGPLKQQLRRLLKDQSMLALCDRIIDNSPYDSPGVGLPIGNLTSQYFANLYLNDTDHWIKQHLKAPAYLRYVDDLMLLGDDKAQLWNCRDHMIERLENLGLQLRPR